MSILFRCPCGRSMVMEADRAGAIVTCPNCKRALRVPSGKDRGVEIAPVPVAAKTRTSRTCPRCNEEVPVDSQICPHCKQVLVDDGQAAEAVPAAAPVAAPVAAVAPVAAAARPATSRLGALKARGAPGARPGQPQQRQGAQVKYGGARTGAFGQMPAGQRNIFLIGGGAAVLILVVVIALLFVTGSANVLRDGRSRGAKAIEAGGRLEATAKFDEAYEGYLEALSGGREEALRSSSQPDDVRLADQLRARTEVLQSLVSQPRTNQIVQWKPQSNDELEKARADNRQSWPKWQKLCLDFAAAGTEAVKVGKTAQSQAEFEAKIGQVMRTFTNLVDKSSKVERAQHSYQIMLASLQDLGSANRHWGEPSFKQYLANAGERFSALHDFVSQPGYPDDIW